MLVQQAKQDLFGLLDKHCSVALYHLVVATDSQNVNVLNHVSLRSVPHHEKTYCCSPRMQLPRHKEIEGCLSKKLLSHLRHKGKQEFKLCLNPASVNSIKLSLPPHTKVMNERMATKKCCSLHNLYGDWCREYACGGRRYSK